VVEVLRHTGAVGRVCVGSFSDARVAAVRRALGPALCTALGPREAVRLRRASRRAGDGGGTPGVACAQLPHRLGPIRVIDRRLVERAHALGLQVHAWTIDAPAEMEELLDLGVDGIMTDSPQTLRDVLTRRGQWHG
jgi:glycerophosphoryl diester phosphodiesterase